MSKMAQEFENRLDEYKYTLYERLKNIVERLDEGLALGETLDISPARRIIKYIDGGK